MTIKEIENGLYWAKSDITFFGRKAQEAQVLGLPTVVQDCERRVRAAKRQQKDLSAELFVRREQKAMGYAWEY